MESLQKAIVDWKISAMSDLKAEELHDLIKVRIDVFVVEQACAYEELDGMDPHCYHLIGKNSENRVVATARIAPENVIYDLASIGRVAVLKAYRGKHYGKKMMDLAIDFCEDQLGVNRVKIAAQLYLKRFYSDLGFEQVSEVYLWDGIEHIDMIYLTSSK